MTRKELTTGDTVKYRYFLNYYGSRDMNVKKGIFIKYVGSLDACDMFYDIDERGSQDFMFHESLIACDILLTEKSINLWK